MTPPPGQLFWTRCRTRCRPSPCSARMSCCPRVRLGKREPGEINRVVRVCCWFPCPRGSTRCNTAATGAHDFWLGTATRDLLDLGIMGGGRRTDDDDTDAWANTVLRKDAICPTLGLEPHLRGSEVCVQLIYKQTPPDFPSSCQDARSLFLCMMNEGHKS
jgi:hypothetical protein